MGLEDPEADGPPSLASFAARAGGAGATAGSDAVVAVGVGRGLGQAAVQDAVTRARNGLAGRRPTLCYVTVAPDRADSATVAESLVAELGPDVVVLGRTVAKKGAEGGVEVLLLSTVDAVTLAVASRSGGDLARPETIHACAMDAAAEATRLLGSKLFTCLIFAHTPGANASAVRQGIHRVCPEAVAYGGPAVGRGESGQGWVLLTRDEIWSNGDLGHQTVVLATVSGSIPFMLSSIVKNWTQPRYQEPLSFMIPKYVDEPTLDLLTAIRYDDWDKFIQCIEVHSVAVNHQWADKQHQSPLLAACGRGRVKMVRYLLEHGADANYRNDGHFTAVMYTRMLSEFPELMNEQLSLLEQHGAMIQLDEDDQARLDRVRGSR